jgi:hypothetical protein
MKVLIIAFPRSGTSLLCRIIEKNPEMEKMYFETNMMKRVGTPRERTLNQVLPKGKNVGEKVIYERNLMGTNGPTPTEYCQLWNKRFKREARIIQIIRHPYDAWNSLLMKKYIARRIENAILRMEKLYFRYIPSSFDEISKIKNCLTIKYEDLIMNPDVIIPKIYKHCELDINYKMKENMLRRKVFLYKRTGFKIHDKRLAKQKNEFMKIMSENIEECLENLNRFPGLEYEI